MKEHLCDTCRHDFATCEARQIVFGIDVDRSARGAEADTVIECECYSPKCGRKLEVGK